MGYTSTPHGYTTHHATPIHGYATHPQGYAKSQIQSTAPPLGALPESYTTPYQVQSYGTTPPVQSQGYGQATPYGGY